MYIWYVEQILILSVFATQSADVYLRLSHGSYGRVEVHYNGSWGTVCDRDWDLNNGNVVCRELGYGLVKSVHRGATYGQGSGPIWMDDVRCEGSERRLSNCSFRGWEWVHYCPWGDASVVCQLEETLINLSLIRLSNGSYGRVELYFNGLWGTICDNGWDINDGNVVCRELGYKRATSVHYNAEFGQGSGPIWISSIGCTGLETKLSNCSFKAFHDCEHADDAGVTCSLQDTFRPSILQLSNGSFGLVQVYYNGSWGTVCDDHWDINDGNVVCRELGYDGAESAPHGAAYGQGSGPIWMDDVRCSGSESRLSVCPFMSWGHSDCSHSEDASVVCSMKDIQDVGEHLRLSSRSYGLVQVYYNGSWGTVCGDSWDMNDGHVVCQELGYEGARSVYHRATYGSGSGSIWMDEVNCSGLETSLLKCPFSGWGNHNNCRHQDDASVDCGVKVSPIRLSAGSRGRVEVYYNGSWGTVCDDGWDMDDGNVVCRQLGYGRATHVYSFAAYGQGSGPIWMDDIDCQGSETVLSACPFNGWAVHDCRHYEDASVACSVEDALRVSLVRLSRGSYGKVEVYNGVQWDGVCADNWNIEDANVVCRELRYGPAESSDHSATFGEDSGPVLMTNFQCEGYEQQLSNCPFNISYSSNHSCHSKDARVVCSMPEQLLQLSYLRLTHGSYGRVEVYYHGIWGTVCDNGWTISDGDVVCRELGYGKAKSVHSLATHGLGEGPIWMSDVDCKGSEPRVTSCPFTGWAINNCSHNEDASVVCSLEDSFLHETAKLVVLPSNTAILNASHSSHFNCTATGHPKLTVRWVKVNDLGKEEAISNGINEPINSQTTTLTASKVGRYKCLGTYSSGKGLNVSVTVFVHAPPLVHLSAMPSPAVFGETLNISCTITQGYPIPSVTLSPICETCTLVANANTKYYTTAVTTNQMGKQIRCEASNGIGETVTKTLYANIKPHTVLTASQTSARTGESLTLKCITFGHPPPTAMLFMPNGIIYNFTTERNYDFNVTVTVGEFGEGGGVYNCSSINSVGQSHATTRIYVVPRAHLSVSLNTLHIGQILEVSCRGYGYPHPIVSLSLPNGTVYNALSMNELNLTIMIGRLAEEGGIYICSATNNVGQGNYNVTINVVPTVDIFVSPGVVQIGDSAIVSCYSFGYPPPENSLSRPDGLVNHFISKIETNVTIGKFSEGAGVYNCSSRNTFGAFWKTTTLKAKPMVRLSVNRTVLRIGERTTVFCQAFGYPPPTMSFFVPNGTLYSTEAMQLHSRSSSVQFKWNIDVGYTAQEGGLYNCSAINDVGKEDDIVIIYIAPRVHLAVTPRDAQFGDTITVACIGYGYPQPITHLLLPNGSFYRSPPLSRLKFNVTVAEKNEEGGVYSCWTINSAGADFEEAAVTVKPDVRIEINNSFVRTGDTVEIRCRGIGYPLPKMSLLTPDGSNHSFISSITVKIKIGIFAKGGGLYTCSASNNNISTTQTVAVNVRLRVKCKPRSQTVMRGESGLINCTGYGYPPTLMEIFMPNGTITTYHAEPGVNEIKQTLIVHVGQSAEGGGNYSFLVKNSLQQRKFVASVNVSLKVERPMIEEGRNKVAYGKNVTITCKASGFPLPSEEMVLLHDGIASRTELMGTTAIINPTYKTSTFSIYFVNVSHAGEYSCHLESTVSTNVSLEIGPHILQSPQIVTAAEGNSAVLSCAATGFPMPTVELVMKAKDSPKITATTNSYKNNVTIVVFWKDINRADMGHYRCKADNGIGKIVFSDWVYVNVHYPPTATVDSHSVSLNISMKSFPNETLKLVCITTGNPIPTVVWSKTNLGALSTSTSNVSHSRILIIEKAEMDDSANYTCAAWNYLGSSISEPVHVLVHADNDCEKICSSQRSTHSGTFSSKPDSSWQATLCSPLQGHICSGVVVGYGCILTSANCAVLAQNGTAPIENIDVCVGQHCSSCSKTDSLGQSRCNKPISIIHHRDLQLNDISIIKLADGILCKHGSEIPVHLPNGKQYTPDSSYISPFVTSWQKVISNRSHLECIRKKKVRLTTHYRGCEQSHLTYRIDDSPFSNGVCAGESGGPLVFERVDDNVRYVLGGIVTWMKDCGTARETGVFTNISTHLDWIKQTCSSS